MKLKFLVAALAFAAASPTFAAIADGSTGNGQLFMSVWDPVAQTSYIRNLNVDMNTFIANGNTSGYSLTYAAASVLSGAYNRTIQVHTWDAYACQRKYKGRS